MTHLLVNRAPEARAMLLLAHGAGAPMDSPFMNDIAALLVERHISTARFEFPFMAARRSTGKKRPAPKAETLCDHFAEALAAVSPNQVPLFIGGKSLGGRVATLLAARGPLQSRIQGVVCLGYPFHPPKKPDAIRIAHLPAVPVPILIVQGDRDPLGNMQDVSAYPLPAHLRLAWLPDGDHDFGPRGASGHTRKRNLNAAADAVASFVAELTP